MIFSWVAIPASDAAASVIYFSEDGGDIGRVNSDGTGLTTLVTGLIAPRWLAIDSVHGKLYWTDPAAGKVQRANLDGSSVETPVSSNNTFDASGIAVDPAAGKVYFDVGLFDPGRMYRMNLDGSGLELLPISGLVFPHGVALDLNANKLYWADGTGTISRSNLDGSAAEVGVLRPPTSDISGVALDTAANRIYWTEFIAAGPRTIDSAGFDGSNMQTLISGLADPTSLVLALSEGTFCRRSSRHPKQRWIGRQQFADHSVRTPRSERHCGSGHAGACDRVAIRRGVAASVACEPAPRG